MSAQTQSQFVKWVRAAHPEVYAAALKRVARKSAMGGLGDDLISDISFNTDDIQPAYDTQALDNQVTSGGGSSWSDVVDSIAGAITAVAPAIVNTKAQLATIDVNAQRARNGYSLVGSGALLGSSSALGGNSTLLIIGALGLGLLVLSKGSHKAS